MYYKTLLTQSKQYLDLIDNENVVPFNTQLFMQGGLWMQRLMNKMDGGIHTPIKHISFNYYGLLKYIICLSVLSITGVILAFINLWLIPMSIFFFYLAEVHLLFLFPLLIDGVKSPLTTSIQQSYKTGILRSVFNTMPIGFYMVCGFFNLKSPLKKWHIGCLSILIWYRDEVRNRL